MNLNEFLYSIGLSFLPKFRIDSKESLEEAALKFRILPFFPNIIKGLSVEEMCAPGMLFGGNYEEGCWEWKGPVIRKHTTAYGKFFNRKAGFVALSLLPDFINLRRSLYPVKEGDISEMLLEIIKENDSLSSTELKKLIFGKKERTHWDQLPEASENLWINTKSKSLESPLQRLQMGGWIIISDFEYKLTKRGERYGWGVARYSTPELTFGELFKDIDKRTPWQSKEFLIESMKKILPGADEKKLEKLIL